MIGVDGDFVRGVRSGVSVDSGKLGGSVARLNDSRYRGLAEADVELDSLEEGSLGEVELGEGAVVITAGK